MDSAWRRQNVYVLAGHPGSATQDTVSSGEKENASMQVVSISNWSFELA
jgi:hypothetical protein